MQPAPVLETRGIVKRFPGVNALEEVSFDLRAGEVHALVGENGAGKSTLIKIITGAIQPDSGDILLDGRPVRFRGPHSAMDHGIAVIYQELTLAPDLTVGQNIMLGREPHRLNILDKKKMMAQARTLVDKIDPSIDVEQPVFRLSIAHQQVVEIAKALAINAKIIIMDEPTAALNESEVDHLLSVTQALADHGVAVVYITHRLNEIFRVANRVTVMKDGKLVATRSVSQTNTASLIEMMIGRRLQEFYPPRNEADGEILLRARNIRTRMLKDVCFTIRKGEIVGIAGLVGSGQTELARAIFGADRVESGEIEFEGKPLHVSSPRDAIDAGMALLPQDRKMQGLMLPRSVRENVSIANLSRISTLGLLSDGTERGLISSLISKLRIRTPRMGQQVNRLSGGNQQKVVLARWLASQAKLLVFDEPTRGIDVGAKAEIYRIIHDLAAQGVGILMFSSELPELLGMSHRLLVMSKGAMVAEIPGKSASEPEILQLMMEA